MKPSPAVSLLLTNLRLLDYDFDSSTSFSITPDVFTSLTNKGKAFEHIIHHLFRTFDPDECALKLQGCWPVYEPAQSRELRNVVFKWLEDLKKSGRLGGVLIRRTTLDDCCGQRYEELLLALSTMVLRDRIEQGQLPNFKPSFAYQQATSTQPSPLYLTPLTIAHRHALGSLLEAKRKSEARWSSFWSLLDSREAQIAALAEQIPEDEAEEPPPKRPRHYEESVRRKWENNWLADRRWLDIILNGDPESTKDQFLELGFEEAFENQHYFTDGKTAPVPRISLKSLENQVAEQRRRVEEIRRLREQALSGSVSPSKRRTASPSEAATTESAERKGLKVEFTKHQALHLKDLAGVPKKNRNHKSEYSELLNSLREEMMLASAPSQRAHDKPEVPVYYHYNEPEQSMGRDLAPAEDLNDGPEVYHLRINLQDGTTGPGSDDSGIQNGMSPALDDGTHDHDEDRMDIDEMDIDSEEKQQQPVYYLNKNPSSISQPIEFEQQTSVSGGGSYLNSSDDDASDPLSSLATSQAPSRQERRTSTMHQDKKPRVRNSYGFGDELHHQESIPGSQQIPEIKQPRVRNSIGFGDDELYAEQIVSTIAGAPFSPDRPSPPKPKSKRAFQQMSPIDSPLAPYESSMDFGGDSTMSLPNPSFRVDDSLVTLAKAGPVSTTPTEDLLRSGDYNSVFKSRPKIALSPTFSPSPDRDVPVKGLNINITGDNFGDSDGDDEDEAMEYIASPLASKVKR
ncbi:hypothetical protein K440DRAFT_627349 [Wilcoxina mikolae CBS 423.85]|nr:hypothetical protein K440DRAFT_627349 [Wilcoxina mikolae CBS 423.85]